MTIVYNDIGGTTMSNEKNTIEYPGHWPERIVASTAPCNVISGPCDCGEWHHKNEGWVYDMIEKYGLEEGK